MPIVQVLTAASGLDIFLRNGAGVLTDPASITYDIKEPAGSTVADDIVPFQQSVGHFDARTTIIPSGFSTAESWSIIWTWTSAGGVTSSKTEEFTVVASLEGAFTSIAEITEQVKEDVAVGAGELTDAQIEIFIQKALDRLNLKLSLQGTENELSIDDSGQIVPSPNSSMQALIVMQTECLIVKRRHSQAIRRGIRVRDGESEIDTTAGFGGHRDVVKDVCGELDKAISDFLRGVSGAENHGGLVWFGNKRIVEEADHDGQSFRVKDFRSPFEDNLGHFSNYRCD